MDGVRIREDLFVKGQRQRTHHQLGSYRCSVSQPAHVLEMMVRCDHGPHLLSGDQRVGCEKHLFGIASGYRSFYQHDLVLNLDRYTIVGRPLEKPNSRAHILNVDRRLRSTKAGWYVDSQRQIDLHILNRDVEHFCPGLRLPQAHGKFQSLNVAVIFEAGDDVSIAKDRIGHSGIDSGDETRVVEPYDGRQCAWDGETESRESLSIHDLVCGDGAVAFRSQEHSLRRCGP